MSKNIHIVYKLIYIVIFFLEILKDTHIFHCLRPSYMEFLLEVLF